MQVKIDGIAPERPDRAPERSDRATDRSAAAANTAVKAETNAAGSTGVNTVAANSGATAADAARETLKALNLPATPENIAAVSALSAYQFPVTAERLSRMLAFLRLPGDVGIDGAALLVTDGISAVEKNAELLADIIGGRFDLSAEMRTLNGLLGEGVPNLTKLLTVQSVIEALGRAGIFDAQAGRQSAGTAAAANANGAAAGEGSALAGGAAGANVAAPGAPIVVGAATGPTVPDGAAAGEGANAALTSGAAGAGVAERSGEAAPGGVPAQTAANAAAAGRLADILMGSVGGAESRATAAPSLVAAVFYEALTRTVDAQPAAMPPAAPTVAPDIAYEAARFFARSLTAGDRLFANFAAEFGTGELEKLFHRLAAELLESGSPRNIGGGAERDAEAALARSLAEIASEAPADGKLREALLGRFRISLAELRSAPETRDVGGQYERLLTRLSILRQAAEAREPSEQRDAVLRQIDRVEDGARLINDINNRHMYAQIPLSQDGRDANVELYVMKRGKRRKLDPEDVTLFLSLATVNLGRVEALIHMGQAGSVSLNLRAVDEAVLGRFRDGRQRLYNALAEAGYKLTLITYKLIDEKTTAASAMKKVNEVFFQDMSMFDYRV